MSSFLIVATPGLLVHLIDQTTTCGHGACARLASRAVIDQADELPEPVLYAIARRLIVALRSSALMDPFVEIAWRDTLSAVRTALRLDELTA